LESDNHIFEIEEITTKHKSSHVLMKEYILNNVKLFRVNEYNQYFKFWSKNDWMINIPMWFKRL
jgi:hypothetical protein